MYTTVVLSKEIRKVERKMHTDTMRFGKEDFQAYVFEGKSMNW